jgi:hypothetical protein
MIENGQKVEKTGPGTRGPRWINKRIDPDFDLQALSYIPHNSQGQAAWMGGNLLWVNHLAEKRIST